MDIAKIDMVVKQHGGDSSALVGILQEVQRQEGFLSRKTLATLSEKLNLPLSRLYALATFYRSFSLVPTGRHRVSVCLGTACHVRGGQSILDRLEHLLGVQAGSTTGDKEFTLETVRCLGCCSLGPIVRIDHEVYGKVTQDKLSKILASQKKAAETERQRETSTQVKGSKA
jgi:NADH-quinone oxidoreductase subunit E